MGFHGDLATQLMEIESFKYENHLDRCKGTSRGNAGSHPPAYRLVMGGPWVVLRDFALNQCWGCTWI